MLKDADLTEIEQATGFTLPLRYRQILLAYPERLSEMGEFGPMNYDLYAEKKALIESNVLQTNYFKDHPQPLFMIGDNGCGDVYAIDTSDESAPVYGWSPHHGVFADNTDGCVLTKLYESIEDYVESLPH